MCRHMQHLFSGSDEVIPPVNEAHPMQIDTDGSGTVFGGQAKKDRLVVEIMDPGRKTIGSTSLAQMGVDEDAAIQEVLPPCTTRSTCSQLLTVCMDGSV